LASYAPGGGEWADPLWATLGASFAAEAGRDTQPVYRWNAAHPLFTTPNHVPDFTALTDDEWAINVTPGTALSTATALGGLTESEEAGQATIFLHNNKRTILTTFLTADAHIDFTPNDIDEDGVPDAVEYWENQIVFLLNQPGVTAVRFPDVARTATPGAAIRNNAR